MFAVFAGEAGTFECLADLAALLSDPDLGEAASATMWRIFMRHPNTEAQVSALGQHFSTFWRLQSMVSGPLIVGHWQLIGRSDMSQ
jgi:hypothetical protein